MSLNWDTGTSNWMKAAAYAYLVKPFFDDQRKMFVSSEEKIFKIEHVHYGQNDRIW